MQALRIDKLLGEEFKTAHGSGQRFLGTDLSLGTEIKVTMWMGENEAFTFAPGDEIETSLKGEKPYNGQAQASCKFFKTQKLGESTPSLVKEFEKQQAAATKYPSPLDPVSIGINTKPQANTKDDSIKASVLLKALVDTGVFNKNKDPKELAQQLVNSYYWFLDASPILEDPNAKPEPGLDTLEPDQEVPF